MRRIATFALFEGQDGAQGGYITPADADYFIWVDADELPDDGPMEEVDKRDWGVVRKVIDKALSPVLSFKGKDDTLGWDSNYEMVYRFGTSFRRLPRVAAGLERAVTVWVRVRYHDDYYHLHVTTKFGGASVGSTITLYDRHHALLAKGAVSEAVFRADGIEGLRRLVGRIRDWVSDNSSTSVDEMRDITGRKKLKRPKIAK
jgi:hypothetical protein